jgi:superfamily II DNA or RNA helicase
VKPRPYQLDVINGSLARWREGFRRIALVVATGGGKTVIFSHLAEMCLAAGLPVLVIAHRTELIDQACEKLAMVAPGRRIGRLKGRVKQYRADVVVASVQTASTPTSLGLLASRKWGLIIVDETHHVAAETYQRVLKRLGAFEDDGPLVLGATATLDRNDRLSLGDTFEAVVEPQIGLLDLIRHPDGPFLVPPRGVRVRISDLDLDKVARQAGDFNKGALARAMSDAMAPKKIIEAWEEHCPGKPTIGFFPSVAFSIEMAEAFRAAGVTAVHLDGATPDEVRRQALADSRAGRVTVLCNVGLFTEGTDLPHIEALILGRVTSSTTLYQQMVGRGLRLHPGKRFCWVLDVTGVTKRHSLASLVSLSGAPRPEDVPDDLLMYEEEVVAQEAEEDHSEPAPEPSDPEPVTYADGDLEHELVDLFGKSHSAWLRTRGGTWFLPAGSFGFLYLRPADGGLYDLCWRAQRGQPSQGVLQEAMEIGYAMAAGDERVAANPIWQAGKDATWRTRSTADRIEARAIADASRLLDGALSRA